MVKSKQAIKPRYFTPQEACIVSDFQQNEKLQHSPILLNPNIALRDFAHIPHLLSSSKHSKKIELDGFYILEAARLDFPEDVQHLSLCDRGLVNVAEEDLTYFTELFYLDVSENNLPFTSFGALPKLKELRIACNSIQTIDDVNGFNRLMYLDLSYNQLSVESILSLSVLPALKELDLCGNSLTTLPSDLSNFLSLEKLLLEYNRFDNNRIFQILSTLPNVRFVDLSHNYLSFIPRECCEYGGLRLLETLDIAFNFFGTEESIEAIVLMNRLKTLILYGNPVLGPTGEDPMFIYIEDLIDKASQIRQASGASIPDVEFLTEIPRKRGFKKGQSLGRHSLYRDFSIVQVELDVPINGSGTWKKKGISTPFTEAMSSRKNLISPHQATDATFITSVVPYNNSIAVKKTTKNAQTDDTADFVMQKIAQEMGLISNEELELFENYASLPPTIFEQEYHDVVRSSARRKEKTAKFIPNYFETQIPPNARTHYSDDDSVDQSLSSREDNAHDHIPNSLFGAADKTILVPTQPIALKTAMKELQRALDQPLTDYNQIPSKALTQGNEYCKETTASKQRQLPRGLTIPSSSEKKLKTLKAVQTSNILLAMPAFTQFQTEQQEKTLDQINSVLEKLNESTERMLDLSTHKISSRNAEVNTTVRKSMDNMRHFAKPQSVRGLVSMVQHILQEFNS